MTKILRILCACLGYASILPLTGCGVIQQIQQVFAKRPSQNMPAYQPVEVLYHDQNWTQQQRTWFYHTTQGTELVPYKWFLALEQPQPTLFHAAAPFADPTYLARFGFLTDPPSPYNPQGLPVGFAQDSVHDPTTGAPIQVVGLTCAACHTGQVEYQGKGVRIDGGTASVDLAAFQTELGYAVAFTDKLPFRFDRFATNVLGKDASSDAKKQLRQQLEAFLKVASPSPRPPKEETSTEPQADLAAPTPSAASATTSSAPNLKTTTSSSPTAPSSSRPYGRQAGSTASNITTPSSSP